MRTIFYRLGVAHACFATVFFAALTGCGDKQRDATSSSKTDGAVAETRGATAGSEVTLYTSVDQEFAKTIVAEFEKRTGIKVNAVYDTEGGKTTGFLMRLRREAPMPKCDVWWSSEVFSNVQLAAEGLLQPYEPATAADIPAEWKDAKHRWTGTAARARVLAYHTERVKREELPTCIRDLADPKWASRLAIANPMFGTTRGHVGAMFMLWGAEAATEYLKALADAGCIVADGNGHAVRLIASGDADLCFTDTDDVWVAQNRGEKVDLTYPTTTPDGKPMWIPCSVSLIKGRLESQAARELVDFLASAELEKLLAQSDSRNAPVRAALREEMGYAGPTPEPMDFQAVAEFIGPAMDAVRAILLK